MRVGFMMAYNEVDWIDWAIEHAVSMCDKLIISEGAQFTAFPDIPERSDDGTLDIIADKSKKYPGFIVVQETERKHQNYRHNQCDNWNRAVNSCSEGDYLVPLDADIFYDDEGIDLANSMMNDGVSAGNIYGRLFAFSPNWEVRWDGKTESHWTAFFKITPGFHFEPTHRPIGAGKAERIGDMPMFHYTWVKPGERVRTRMRTSGMFPGMVEWFDSNWSSIELKEGVEYPSHTGGVMTLHRYHDVHPSSLDGHPWFEGVEDMR